MTTRWEFPKIGDRNIAPEIAGSLLEGPQKRVTLFFVNFQISSSMNDDYWDDMYLGYLTAST